MQASPGMVPKCSQVSHQGKTMAGVLEWVVLEKHHSCGMDELKKFRVMTS
jgi:hypothetical protein